MNYIIWKSNVDKKFDVWVERVAPYEGELVISEDGKMLTIQQVTITYDAKFGPDIFSFLKGDDSTTKYLILDFHSKKNKYYELLFKDIIK